MSDTTRCQTQKTHIVKIRKNLYKIRAIECHKETKLSGLFYTSKTGMAGCAKTSVASKQRRVHIPEEQRYLTERFTLRNQWNIYSRVYKHPVFYGTEPFVHTFVRSLVSCPEADVSTSSHYIQRD